VTSAQDSDEADRVEWLADTILEAADAAGISISVIAARPKARYVFATHATEELLGRSSEELLNGDPLSVFSEEEREHLRPVMENFQATGTLPPALEVLAHRPDGHQVALDVGLGGIDMDDAPAVVCFAADVSQRRLALESLKRSERRFRSVVERIPEAVFMTVGSSVTYANPAFQRVFALGPGDVPGLDVSTLVHAADAPRFRERMAELAKTPMQPTEYRMRALDGRNVTLELSALAVDLEDRPTYVWLGHDVTRRKELEGQLLQADRLAVLGTLAAGMAHAINNPLSYTLLNLEHVARRMRHLASDRDYYAEARVRLAEAHDGADRVAKVVRQMRALSRARTSEPGPVDVRAVLDNVLAMVGNEIRHRALLTMRLDPVPRVWAIEGELEQAFLGLVVYVARSLPEEAGAGHQIRLTTSTDPSGNAVVTVSDDGRLLTGEERTHLFDPFASGEAKRLGLAVCHAILTSVSGHIEVESGPVRGTTFKVVLPPAASSASRGAEEPTAERRPPQVAGSAPRTRVLVIDDDPGVGNALRAMLAAEHEVKSVESAREGLRILLGDDEFDVVFCDLVMPELSGIDLYCAVELNRPERVDRLVFMTGGVFTPEAEHFLAQVPNRRIEKPFSLARVEELLAEAAARRRSEPR
jgi:PAS domain S-box-containing protein